MGDIEVPGMLPATALGFASPQPASAYASSASPKPTPPLLKGCSSRIIAISACVRVTRAPEDITSRLAPSKARLQGPGVRQMGMVPPRVTTAAGRAIFSGDAEAEFEIAGQADRTSGTVKAAVAVVRVAIRTQTKYQIAGPVRPATGA